MVVVSVLPRYLTSVPSVVIKVGMVGDSQIGKTSLMVKYVEGSFDEDYIQTLGMSLPMAAFCSSPEDTLIPRAHDLRRKFHGEDDLSQTDDDHLLNLGP